MIAPGKKRLAKAADADLALSEPHADPDAPIKSKKPRLRGRARAEVAKNVAPTINGPSSKRPPKLSVGTVLTRQYKGKRITVKVLGDRQFEYAGKTYRSLSSLANEITKSHVSGNAWFGLRARPKAKKS